MGWRRNPNTPRVLNVTRFWQAGPQVNIEHAATILADVRVGSSPQPALQRHKMHGCARAKGHAPDLLPIEPGPFPYVRAKHVPQTQDWRRPTVAAHLSGKDDNLVGVAPILERYGDFAAVLEEPSGDEPGFKRLRQSETTGRPLGSQEWMEKLEKMTGKTLKPQKRGPKAKDREDKEGDLVHCHRI